MSKQDPWTGEELTPSDVQGIQAGEKLLAWIKALPSRVLTRLWKTING